MVQSRAVNVYQRVVDRAARNPGVVKLFVWIATALDRRIIRWSRGRVTSGIGTAYADSICLLHCTGAKSGRPRTVPLLATPVGDALVIVASNGGATSHPAWYWNLKKTPDCEVELHGERSRRRAREALDVERQRLWEAAVAKYAGYGHYAGRAGRTIPVMVLDPV
jgi:deazaflavin-dependent oxidoreductase (nitroreductase family)